MSTTDASPQNRRSSVVLSIAAVLIAALAVVFRMKNRSYAQSTDLALHYQLADTISHTWLWPTLTKPLATMMSDYPPLSHYLGAVAGLPFHSSLMGVHVVAALGVFGCYLMLIRGISVGSLLASAAALALAATGLAAARTQFAAEGFEIFLNFFYAQIVGECVFLAFVFWLCATRRQWPFRLFVSAALLFVCGWLYLITSVEIALAYLVLETLILMREVLQTRTIRLARLTPILVGVVLLPALVAIHPETIWMMHISGNNGAITLKALEHMVPLFSGALLALGLALGLFAPAGPRWSQGTLPLATAACASALAALTQQAAFSAFGMGSEYAVKKYGYSVFTLLVFCAAAGVATLIESGKSRRSWSPFVIVAPPMLAAAAVFLLPASQPNRLDRFADYQRYMRQALGSGRLPPDALTNTASRDSAFAWPLNFAATLVDLAMDPNRAYLAELAPPPVDPATYAFSDDPFGTFPQACITPGSTYKGVFFAKVHCDALSLITSPQTVRLSASSVLPRYFSSGWSGKEGGGVWNNGKTAELAMHFNDAPDKILFSFDGGAFLPPQAPVQHVLLSVGDTQLGSWTFDTKTPGGSEQVAIPGALLKAGDLRLTFHFPDAVAPAALKLSGDPRALAFSMSGFSVNTGLGPGDRIDLSQMESVPASFVSGWSGKESKGVWSDGPSAAMDLFVKTPPEVLKISFEGGGFMARTDYVQHVIVKAGDEVVGSWVFNAKSSGGVRTALVPRRLIVGNDLKLDFSFPDAASPLENRISGDTRRLAYFVRTISLDK